MKTLTSALTFAFALIFTTLSFAGNRPALTYPEARLAATTGTVAVTPWQKGALAYQGGIVVAKAGNNVCPVMGNSITSKREAVVTLSNGRHMEVCCTPCKQEAEKDLAKYQAFMY